MRVRIAWVTFIAISLAMVGCSKTQKQNLSNEVTKSHISKEVEASQTTTQHAKDRNEELKPTVTTPGIDKKLVKLVHLDDVIEIPTYQIETYKEGEKMPAAKGNVINCTYSICYRVVFDVEGAAEPLAQKLQDRKILDASYDGTELPTIEAQYWSKDVLLSTRFYK